MFLGAIGLATGAWALNATDRQTPFNNEGKSDGQRDFGYGFAANTTLLTPATQLRPPAQDHFQEYRALPYRFRYKAFAVEPESGEWGQSSQISQPEIAIDHAIERCQRRSTRDCQVYAVGDIIVLGLADWKTEVAVMLYRVKPGATNDDLEAVTSRGGGAKVVALRRSVLHAAAEMGSIDALAAMLDRGIDVVVGSDGGAPGLFSAASRGRREAVALLLEHGADVNTRNGVNKTALSVAVLANNFARLRNLRAVDHDAVIRLLVDAGGAE
ncbi:MAG: ankyrin repeat domain-containing protein [Gammaproteobacteria bacterium]|nr:ankyrin repeat domain-containing protein [Gammaproteobacteria bacterium]